MSSPITLGRAGLAALLASTIALFGIVTTAQAAKTEVRLRIGNANQPTQMQNLMDVKFAERVKDLSNGRITVQVINGAQLGGEKELVQHVSSGTLDFATVSVWNASGFVPELDLLSGFFLFKNWDDFRRVTQSEAVLKEMRDLVKKRKVGFQFLNWGTTGTFDMYGDRAFSSLATLQGVKMRIPDSRLQENTWKALGMVTVIVPFSEEYTAMQSHVANASQHSISSILTGKFYEVGPYTTLTHALYNESATFQSDRSIKKLSAADQAIIERAISEASIWSIDETIKQEKNLADQLRAKPGVTVVDTPSDIAAWQAKVEPVNREYAQKIGAGHLLDMLLTK